MNKKIIIGVVVVAVVVLAWWMFASKPATAPVDQNETTSDTSYNEELDGLNQADLNAEFQVTDSQVNKL